MSHQSVRRFGDEDMLQAIGLARLLIGEMIPFRREARQVQAAEGKLYLFLAINCTSRFTFEHLVEKASQTMAAAFLKALVDVAL